MDAFHKRRFDEAARRFEELVEKYPDEKEFRDRAKMYLAACRNGKKARAAAPGEPEDLYHAAVFEKNRGNLEKALELLKKNAGTRDGDGRLHYLAACCHALPGDVDQAITNLRKAIAADDQNRIQARLDTDLAALRGHAGLHGARRGRRVTAAVVVLAAGSGVRMRSARPKVLHDAAGRPLLDRVLDTRRLLRRGGRPASSSSSARTGSGRAPPARVAPRAAVRPPGTAARDGRRRPRRGAGPFGDASRVVVLSGDVPLLGRRTP